MPEATALKPTPLKPELQKPQTKENSWVTYNDQGQVDFQKSVQKKLAEVGITHDPIPIEQKELPIHVPRDGSTFTQQVKEGALEVPETFKPDSDNIRHFVDFSGQGAPVRTGDAGKIHEQKSRREWLKMQLRNSSDSKKGLIETFKDFFYDDDKKPKAA